MVVFFSSVPEVEGSSSVQFCGVVFSLVPRSLVFLLCYFATILLINIFLPHHQDHFLLVAMEPFLACSLPFLSLWACSVVLPWVFELDTLMIFHYFNFIVCAFFTTLLRYNSHTICPFIVQQFLVDSESCSRHHHQFQNIIITPKRNSMPSRSSIYPQSTQTQAVYSLSVCICLFQYWHVKFCLGSALLYPTSSF